MEATWWTKPEQLDRDQKKAVALPIDGNHLIVGPPGSGKTNLVLLRAAYLQARGKSNFLVFTFGRVLREFLASGTDAARVSPERIVTYVGWASEILKGQDPDLKLSQEFRTRRAQLLEGLENISDAEVSEHRLDCILLDECQDYSAQEITCLMRFCDQIYAAGDNRQRIYQTSGAIKTLESLCSKTELTFHYRNGRKICQLADGIMSEVDSRTGLKATSQYKEAEMRSRADCHPPEALDSQIRRSIPQIADQLRAYPRGLIGVLCPRVADVKAVYNALRRSELADDVQLQLHEAGYEPIDPDRRVMVGTISGAKGLEYRAVHLLGMDRLETIPARSKQVRLAYTGVTRAKTSLDIYRAGDLIGRLENGVAALKAPHSDEVDLNALFRS
jgi:superfamily I DNA/RNA helicase